MSDNRTYVLGGLRGGKREAQKLWVGQQRGTTWVIGPDGSKEVYEDAEYEVVEPKKLQKIKQP